MNSCDDAGGEGSKATKEPVVGEISGSLIAKPKTMQQGSLVAIKLAVSQGL